MVEEKENGNLETSDTFLEMVISNVFYSVLNLQILPIFYWKNTDKRYKSKVFSFPFTLNHEMFLVENCIYNLKC